MSQHQFTLKQTSAKVKHRYASHFTEYVVNCLALSEACACRGGHFVHWGSVTASPESCSVFDKAEYTAFKHRSSVVHDVLTSSLKIDPVVGSSYDACLCHNLLGLPSATPGMLTVPVKSELSYVADALAECLSIMQDSITGPSGAL